MKSTLTRAHAQQIANLKWGENKPARAAAMLREHIPEMGIVETQRYLNSGSWESLFEKLVRDFVEPDDVKLARLRMEHLALGEEILKLEQEIVDFNG